jgi:polysaccharide export outer membrane protein
LVLSFAVSYAFGLQETASQLESLTLLPSEAGLVAVITADGVVDFRIVQEQHTEQRVVLDVLGVTNPLRHYYPSESHPFLERILMYEYPEANNPKGTGPLARVIFELKREVEYSVSRTGHELHVTFTDHAMLAQSDHDIVPPTQDDAIAAEKGETDKNGDAAVPPPESDLDGAETPALEEIADSNIPSNVNIEPGDVPLSLFFRAATGENIDYRLGREDVIEIRVFELDQLNRTVRVSGNGSIELPLVGRLPASGMTAEEVAEEVASRLRDRYVQNPQVSIFILEFNSRKVSLLGAVQTPASYPLIGQRRLLEILAEAGSLTLGAGQTLYIFRQTTDGRSARLTVPLNELLLYGDPRWNVVLMPGDVISVPPEAAIAISVLGALNSPGVHKLPVGDRATLLKAIALAGGLNERASKKIQIRRRENGKDTVIKVNLGDILSGKTPDLILQEGDVVVVNESFF